MTASSSSSSSSPAPEDVKYPEIEEVIGLTYGWVRGQIGMELHGIIPVGGGTLHSLPNNTRKEGRKDGWRVHQQRSSL